MLRFSPHSPGSADDLRRRRKSASRLRWRVWMLLIALGLVIATMRQLAKPSTADRLGQLFSAPAANTQQDAVAPIILSGSDQASDVPNVDRNQTVTTTESEQSQEPPSNSLTDSGLEQIEDNTYFRPAEDTAWFNLFDKLQQTSPAQLATQSLGELTYAQLLKQPKAYRGKVVTLRGTARREEIATPAENTLGLKTYHRLVIQPRGGGHWPFVVYCLNLPEEFPRGDGIQAPLSVTGYFFKNWSYAWQDGLGIAPVVLAKNVDWKPAVTPSSRRKMANLDLTKAMIVAGLFALLVVYAVVSMTRRPAQRFSRGVTLPDSNTATQSVHEQLKDLAEIEDDA